MSVKLFKKLYTYESDLLEKIRRIVLRHQEIKKFKDPRRVRIFSTVTLSKKQEHQIDELYEKNYGEKIPYIWHRHFTAFTGRFDVNYFPELLFIPEFEHFMNYNHEYAKVLSDKNLLPYLTRAAGVHTPHVYLSRVEGLFRDENGRQLTSDEFEKKLSNLGEAFVKPSVDSSSGHGCAVINLQNGVDQVSGVAVSKLLTQWGYNFVIQERLKCHESIAKIYPHSVNTFRIITYRWKDEICHMPVIMRIGSGGKNVDNAHAGGMFIAVEDDGTLHEKAFTEFNKQYTVHPDTKLVFKDYKIPHMERVIEAAKQMHALLPQLGCSNWDFTLNKNGEPTLIEINLRGGGIWVIEMAHGKGPFGERTAEVLRWLAVMRKTPYSKQKSYKYGQSEA